uniref:Alternative protein NAP1L2 n=1 Tax=Homo sapiens TaxID=9606 RepID=L8E8P2_HUMAN|nr:alternative protein NAP1L2 [Homo sapiens]
MPLLGLETMGSAVKKLPLGLGKKGKTVKILLLGPGKMGKKVAILMRTQRQTVQKDLSVMF